MEPQPLAPEHNNRPDDEVVVVAPLATTNDGVLPTDVLRDVLLRLPAKELCRRIRLVCKSWRSLTSDPTFAGAHACRHPLVAGLHKDLREVHIVDVRRDIVTRRLPVARQCNDLTTQLDVVCASACKGPSFVLDKGRREFSTLPEVEGRNSCFPTILGHIPSTGEFKLLHFELYADTDRGCYVQPCHVVTLNGSNGGWRVAPRPAVPVDPASGNRAVIGGVAYFLMMPDEYIIVNSSSDDDVEPDSIASFDLAAEEWNPTPIRGPLSSSLLNNAGDKLSYEKHRKYFQLTELNGSLVIVHCKDLDCSLDIWFLVDKDKGIWCRRYSVQCSPEWEYRTHLYPVVILDDGRIVMWMSLGSKVMRTYDPRTSTWTTSTVMGTEGTYRAVGTYIAL